jgi:1-acyl-sn-glycerol-3-phosphate acyltransferase
MMMVNMFHTTKGDMKEIEDTEGAIIAAGPHYMGLLDAVAIASKLKGTPPSILATTVYNNIPGAASFMKMFKTIPVPPKPEKGAVVARAKEVVDKGGLVLLFPQGGFAKIGEEPLPVYSGAAQLAIQSKKPIHVIRLGGYWSLDNWLIPLQIRNNSYFRAILAMFCHLHNISVTYCCKIDFHLKAENAHLPEEQLVEHINAQLYSYFRHTRELTPEQIAKITKQIPKGDHHLRIWGNKSNQVTREKELAALRKTVVALHPAQVTAELETTKLRAEEIEKEIAVLRKAAVELDATQETTEIEAMKLRTEEIVTETWTPATMKM